MTLERDFELSCILQGNVIHQKYFINDIICVYIWKKNARIQRINISMFTHYWKFVICNTSTASAPLCPSLQAFNQAESWTWKSVLLFLLVIAKSFTCYSPLTLQAVRASWGSSLMMCPWKQGEGSHVSYHSTWEKPSAWFCWEWCQSVSKSARMTPLFSLISTLDKASDVILQTQALRLLTTLFLCYLPPHSQLQGHSQLLVKENSLF